VEGSVQRAGNRILVNVQLIEAATDRHVWSANFKRDLSDFFEVQSEVARAIAAEVQVRLTPEDQARLARARPVNREAVEAYLRGMQQWWQWSEEGTANALRYFEKAVEIEPNYAPAYAGLALTHIAGTWAARMRPRDAVPKGKATAQKAIQLDPMLADAYVALGYAELTFDWDWPTAERDFKRALELSPNSTLALDGYCNLLVARGRFEEAIDVMNNALELDPLSPGLESDLGWAYYNAGQFHRGIPHCLKALELDRNFFQAHLVLGWSYLFTGRSAEALGEFKVTLQLQPDSPAPQEALGYFYGVTGRREEALQVLARLDQLAKTRYIPRNVQASVYLGLGQKELALDWLEKACDEHDAEVAFLKVDPEFAPLRSEPRFQALLKKVGLDQ